MQTLESYAAGSWLAGTGKTAQIENPASEEVIAETSSEGVDFGAMLRTAREQGGPALRAMTFAERGKLLKDLSAAIHEHREELIELVGQDVYDRLVIELAGRRAGTPVSIT